ncbi:MAG TPA: lysylphosphatidylglycerol synthase domain-containing protein [Acidimicrobiales bacterium]|nr:lysylphosphatidylglycerol synthase domain-containing protein [Acidimicrobiales bacterium]
MFVAAGLAFVGRALAQGIHDGSFHHLSAGWVGAGGAVAIATMTYVAARWSAAATLVGAELSVGDAVPLYYQGEVGKYLPGAVWAVVGRGELAVRNGVARSAAYASVAASLAGLYLAGALAAVVLLPAAAGAKGAGAVLGVIAFLVVGVAALHPAVISRAIALIERVARRKVDVIVPSWRDGVGLVVGYLPAWIGVGVAQWLCVRALGLHAPIAHVAFASAVAWCAGFLAIPAPGGIGVRESIFVLTSGMAAHDAAAAALLARLAFVVADGAGAALGALWMTRRSR